MFCSCLGASTVQIYFIILLRHLQFQLHYTIELRNKFSSPHTLVSHLQTNLIRVIYQRLRRTTKNDWFSSPELGSGTEIYQSAAYKTLVHWSMQHLFGILTQKLCLIKRRGCRGLQLDRFADIGEILIMLENC